MAFEAVYLEHVTRDGERWDQLAARYYGDPHKYEPIIAANPAVMIDPILPAGLVLRIPLVDSVAILPDMVLPPWKR